jgi:hypothetical protein
MITFLLILACLFIYTGGVAFTLGFIEMSGEKLDNTFYGMMAIAFVAFWFIGWLVLVVSAIFLNLGIKQLYALGKIVYGEEKKT